MKFSPQKILLILFLFPCFLKSQDNNGGFEKVPYELQETAPGMRLIEGNVIKPGSKLTRNDSVFTFFISITEETNGQYIGYLNWLKKYYSQPTYKRALPDTNVWLKENITDSLKDYLARNYLRNERFKNYPVVGVSPEQVMKYAIWKTDRVNEMILVREGLLDIAEPTDSTDEFSTEAYLSGKWRGPSSTKLPSFDQPARERDVRMEDGIFSPPFRMVTEAEWKLAALAMGDKEHYYLKIPKLYDSRKFDKKDYYGFFFIRPEKKGKSKKNLFLTLKDTIRLRPVYHTKENNYRVKGLYDNVSEWVINAEGKPVLAGGSWREPHPGYEAVYKPGDKSYSIVYPFPAFFDDKISAVSGFRLAISYIGVIDKKAKRKKIKYKS
ncbi:MAG: Sulphatase-modifying factor protein [Bacteroidetes bacterium]|jgi:formylglycine-generating enzyme required for sulfatase activity|nr:Sulphatase-modifying factor protein [Bacteroidota bacterium]